MEHNCLAPGTEILMQDIEEAVSQFRKTGDPYYLDMVHYCSFKARDKQNISSHTDEGAIQKASRSNDSHYKP